MNIARRLNRTVIGFCILLAACGGPPAEPVAHQTPSPVVPSATSTPVATSTPPATFTPVYSPTPESLPSRFVELCEGAFSKAVSQGTPQAPALVLSSALYANGGWEISGFVRFRMDQYQTLACSRKTREKVLTYTDGASGWRISSDVRVVDIASGNVIASASYQGGNPPSIKFEPGDKYGSTPGIKLLEDVFEQQKDPGTVPLDVTASSLAISADGKWLAHEAAGSKFGTAIVIRDADTLQIVTQFESRDAPDSMEFSLDGQYLLVTSFSGQQSTLWDVRAGIDVQHFSGRYGTLSPDGRMVAIIDEDADTLLEKLSLRDATSGTEVQIISDIFEYPFFTSVRFSPDGERLVFETTSLVVWNTREWKVERKIETPTGGDILAFSPDGGMLATASKFHAAGIGLWNPSTGEHIHTIAPIGNPDVGVRVETLAFSPDGRYLAAGLSDETVRVWETATWLEVHTFYGNFGSVEDIEFSPDGKRLYASVLAALKIFDLE
jgi:WD40 repeat protein